jgi:hypothetical protein
MSDENEPRHKRSAKVTSMMREASACCQELYREKHCCLGHFSLDKFFWKQNSTISTPLIPKLSPPFKRDCHHLLIHPAWMKSGLRVEELIEIVYAYFVLFVYLLECN